MSEYEAGREVEVLVAERVFESPEPGVSVPVDAPPEYYAAWNRGELLSEDGLWRIRPAYDANSGWDPKPFSREFYAVWMVVEKVVQGSDWQLELSGPHGGWRAEFVWSGPQTQWRRPPSAYAEADTAPLAICLAALKAVED